MSAAVSRYYATGKRKNSIARVWMMPGSGKVTINDKPMDQYFGRDVLKMIIRQPFEVTGTVDKFDVLVSVLGGGNSGQAGAIGTAYPRRFSPWMPSHAANCAKKVC